MTRYLLNRSPLILSILLFSSWGISAKAVESGKSSLNVNIKTFGAVGDGKTLDTKAIQKAIDLCGKNRGGTVRIPEGDFVIGTIRLKSNVTLSLDYGARLLGSQNQKDYDSDLDMPREGKQYCLIYAKDASNITIEGLGVIDGRGTPEFFPRKKRGREKESSIRPRLLRMANCHKLRFSGITYKRPAFWGLHLIDCRDIHFTGVTIRFRNNGYNNDGLDIDGCENVLIENCDIDSGDDAICLKSSKNPCRNIVVRNCKVTSNTAPLKFGTSSRGGFINVKVTNCYFYDSPMGAIKLQIVDGGRMENIDISRIVMKNVGNPIFIRLGNRGRLYEGKRREGPKGKSERAPVGSIRNIRISDIRATVTVEDPKKAELAAYKKKDSGAVKQQDPKKLAEKNKSKTGPIMIAGIPGHLIEDVVLENIQISYPGGGTHEDSLRQVPEDVARYPEQYFFGTLPAWGAYVRHARNVRFKNVKLSTRSADKRKEIILDDTEGFIND